ncbi:MAG: triose-phosphate isomerase [Clostridiales bacterium]
MKIIAGNWKMNGVPSENIKRLEAIKTLVNVKEDDVIVFPPYVSLGDAKAILAGSGIAWGAQNVHFQENGAFTGEISVPMLKDLGATYCLVGHSERRLHFGENHEFLAKKLKALMAADIIPIFCIGETLEQREAGAVNDVLANQLRGSLIDLPKITKENLIIAYEPIWAIGTGKTATSQDADATMGMIREVLKAMALPADINLLYGGSAKPENAKALLSEKNIDGLLIGGAALSPESFNAMVNWRI